MKEKIESKEYASVDYKTFYINDNTTFYVLNIGEYDPVCSTTYESFIECHNGARFTTYDKANDYDHENPHIADIPSYEDNYANGVRL